MRIEPIEPNRREAGMTVEEILLRGPGARRGQPIQAQPRRGPRPPIVRYPPPSRSGIIRWIRSHPWLAALTAYAVWMFGWGAHIWRTAWV